MIVKVLRRYKVRRVCRLLLLKAMSRFRHKEFPTFRNKRKFFRIQKTKKFSSVFYKNQTKLYMKRLLSRVDVDGVKLKYKQGSFLLKPIPLIKMFSRRRPRRRFNYRIHKLNRDAFFRRKKKLRLPRKKKTKKMFFYSMFPKELFRDQPLTRFYRTNLDLLTINYDILLSFHTAVGNNFRSWVNPIMFSYVLGIRNEMILFDLSLIFLRIKKGLQVVFQVSKQRGSILGYIDVETNYKFSGKGFDHFLRSWLAGYLTNYKFVMKNLIALKRKKFFDLTRRQQKFFYNLVTKNEVSKKYYYKFFKLYKKFTKKGIPKIYKKKIPAIPQFGFSLEDQNIWLNESHKIGNRVMAICDTESFPQYIDFPIIANQKSLSFSFFLVKIVTEGIYCGKRLDYFSFIGFNRVIKYLR